MRKWTFLSFLLVTVLLSSCGKQVDIANSVEEKRAVDLVHLDGDEAAEVLASDATMTVIDVRTASEFAEGHIAGAVNIDFMANDFEAKLAALDREKSYLMHCASGSRSSQALPVFEKLHFKRLYHLETGFKGWIDDKQPVEK